MFCSYSPVYRDASGFAIAFSGDRRFRSPSPKTNQGRIAKCAQKPVTIRRGGARPSRQQKTRIKKMFGDFADCANSPNIFSHMAWPRREGTRPSHSLMAPIRIGAIRLRHGQGFRVFSVFCNKPSKKGSFRKVPFLHWIERERGTVMPPSQSPPCVSRLCRSALSAIGPVLPGGQVFYAQKREKLPIRGFSTGERACYTETKA